MYDHGAKAQVGYMTCQLPNSTSTSGSGTPVRSMKPDSGHQPPEHHHFTTAMK